MFKKKKGFTIVELVIVIAVIAVLAAILIPTFSNVVGDAQKSKDLQLARDIHVILQAERSSESKVLTLEEAKAALAEEGIKRFKVKYKENALYWDPVNGYMILYNYEDDRALYPEEYKGASGTTGWELVEGDADPLVPIDIVKNIYPKDSEVLYLEGNTDVEQVNRGDSYSLAINFAPNYEEKYTITHFSVIMAGSDVTSSVVEDNRIYIPNVRGKVEINFYAIENAVSTATTFDGSSIYNNGLGYLENYYISKSSNPPLYASSNATGYIATGWMEIPWETDQKQMNIYVYLKNGTLSNQTKNNYRYYFYDTLNKAAPIHEDIIGFAYHNGTNYLKISLNKDENPEHGSYNYFRLSGYGLGENLIVSFNNPILLMDESTLVKSEEPVVVPTVYYDVILNGDVTLNGELIAEEGTVYSASVTPPLGYEIKSVTVKMDGKVLTSAYHLNTIIVNGVNGDIEIDVVTEPISFEEGTKFDINLSSPNEKTIFGGELKADAGKQYTATLTAIQGATIDYVIVEMSNITIISETPYSNTYTISIDKVYGDVNITYMSTLNKVETAQKFKALPMDGYANGYYLSSGTTPKGDKAGYVTTGLINIPVSDSNEEVTIYIYSKNGLVSIAKDARYCFFDGINYEPYYTTQTANIKNYEVISDNYVKFTINNNLYKSFAFSSKGVGEDLMVKFNEEINFYDVETSNNRVTLENNIAVEGLPYTTKIETELGHKIKNVVAKINGEVVDVEFNTTENQLTINNVYGDLEIIIETEELVFEDGTTFNVTYENHGEDTIFIGNTTVEAAALYEATLTANNGVLEYVTVYMGDTIIISEKLFIKEYKIQIEKVYDNLKIVYSSTSNILETALNYDGNPYGENGEGYYNDKYISIEPYGNLYANTQTGYVASGWMYLPWSQNDDEIIIYIYIKDGEVSPAGKIRYYFYENELGTEGVKTTSIKTIPSGCYELVEGNASYLKITLNKTNHSSYKYFRLSVEGLGENLKISFNEPIQID